MGPIEQGDDFPALGGIVAERGHMGGEGGEGAEGLPVFVGDLSEVLKRMGFLYLHLLYF